MDNLKFVDKIKEVFMKKLLAMMALSVGLMVNAQTVDLLKQYRTLDKCQETFIRRFACRWKSLSFFRKR